MTHTTDIVQLIIQDENYDNVYYFHYRNLLLNKKEILKFLTASIEDLDLRKTLKDLVKSNHYSQESFTDLSLDISRALF